MHNRRWIHILTLILLPVVTFAQGGSTLGSEITKMLPNPAPLAPNAAAIAKYGDYPVSHYTGVPDISIPLYEVKSGSLSIPITLSYHAGGIKYTDQASWVGLGWSLSAGGQVTRQAYGKPDEQFYYHNPFPTSVDICDYAYKSDLANGNKDAQPDLFSYTYPGKSGKFMLTQDTAGVARDYFLIPYEPIKIRDEDYSEAFNWFEITDEAGVVYRFGRDANNVVAADATTDGRGGTYTSAWHLMNMAAPNANDNISISYQDIGMTSTTDINQSFSIVDMCNSFDAEGSCTPNSQPMVSTQNISTTSFQHGPHEILFEGGKVEFIPGGFRSDLLQAKSLAEIKIYGEVRGAYLLKKSIKFVYSYFTNSNGSINLRLKLDGIQMLDASGNVVNQYLFSYFTDTFSWDAPFNSLRRDLWGFYNGATSNTNLIPVMSVNYNPGAGGSSNISIGGAVDRNANITYLKEGVLKKIQFPTGGYTEFDFEEHKYYDGASKSVGGLRVTKITSDDGTGQSPIVKTYKYGLAESGFGEKTFSDRLSHFTNEVTINHRPTSGGEYGYTNRTRTFFSSSMLAMEGNEGSPVLYPSVTEYSGTSTTNIGKTVYEYDGGSFTNPDTDQGIMNSGKTFRSSKSWMRGKLTKKSVYNAAGSLLSKTEIGYQTFQWINKEIGYISAKRIIYTGLYEPGTGQFQHPCLPPNEGYDGAEYLAVPLSQATGAIRQAAVAETVYPEGDSLKFVRTVTATAYDPTYLQPTSVSKSVSNSIDKLITKLKYPFSYTYNNSETGNAKALRLLKEKNIISTPVEQYVLRENSGVISGHVSTFMENPANTSQLVPETIYVLESATPATESSTYTELVSNALSINALFKKRVRLSHTAQGNVKDILRVDNDGDANDMPVTYVWGYNNTHPVAEVKNAGNTEVLVQNFEDIAATAGSAHTGAQYYAGDYTVSFTMPNARSYTIDYWYLQTTWKYIRKTYTGTSMVLNEGGAIDDVRIYPQDALITTWTHDPVYGPTSAIDSNGRTQFYTYDSYGRLQLISDTDQNVVKGYDYHYKN